MDGDDDDDDDDDEADSKISLKMAEDRFLIKKDLGMALSVKV